MASTQLPPKSADISRNEKVSDAQILSVLYENIYICFIDDVDRYI